LGFNRRTEQFNIAPPPLPLPSFPFKYKEHAIRKGQETEMNENEGNKKDEGEGFLA
jgi:hypothetical protein